MTDRSKYAETESNDLKAKNFIGKNFKLVISRIEEVHYDESEDQPANDKLALHFEGREKRLILNTINTESLVSAYGPDDDEWVGKEIQLTTKDYTAKGYGHGWILTPLGVDFDDDIPF